MITKKIYNLNIDFYFVKDDYKRIQTFITSSDFLKSGINFIFKSGLKSPGIPVCFFHSETPVYLGNQNFSNN